MGTLPRCFSMAGGKWCRSTHSNGSLLHLTVFFPDGWHRTVTLDVAHTDSPGCMEDGSLTWSLTNSPELATRSVKVSANTSQQGFILGAYS